MDESDSGEAGTCDLIVLGLPWKATENDIRDYFESYGPMAMVQLKTKEGGQSKGFAFIRFKDLDVQEKVLLTRHMIQERWCDVKGKRMKAPKKCFTVSRKKKKVLL